jgi:hypothetical protein
MKFITKAIWCCMALSFFTGCKKNGSANTPATPAVPQVKCAIKSETTSLSGNQKNFEYKYDNKGNLIAVNVTAPSGSPLFKYETSDQSVVASHEYLGKINSTITKYDVADIRSQLPAKAFVSLQDGDTLRVNYYTYFFFYNSKNQLVTVGEQTDHIIGDVEYDLNIFYNAQDNVSGLQYVITTGTASTTNITVTGYDDKPTPYAAVKGWPYYLINFAWDNYDPEPILTALSKNNPLNYSIGSGANLFKREMVYKYNSDGFPTERQNTNKNINGEYTFLQTFSYTCK